MKRFAEEERRNVIARLNADCDASTVLVGFDGYVDSLYRVVKTRGWDDEPDYYGTIGEYGRRICAADGRSADIDLHLQARQFGGNAPLMADGLAALGDKPMLIGALGWPEMDAAFDGLHPQIETNSIAEPCQTIALEFNDGKIMMGDTQNSANVSWKRLCETIGDECLDGRIAGAELVAVLNWSAMQGVTQIVREIASRMRREQLLFIDISDPTSLPGEKLAEMMQTVREIGGSLRVALGLNENEAASVMGLELPHLRSERCDRRDCERHGETLRRTLRLECLTIHANAYAIGFDANGSGSVDGFWVDKTRFSTGAGDHYNAAFCHGYMRGWPLGDCLTLAGAASSFFVRYGKSPERGDLVSYLKAIGGTRAVEE